MPLVKYELVLRKELFKIYENKLIKEFNLEISEISNYKRELSPIIYVSLLNKKISPKPRIVIISKEFVVPSKYVNEWINIKSSIESGEDINKYLSKENISWQKVDYLLFSCNITHMHFASRKGGGINNELIFGVATDKEFYVLFVGGHDYLYKPDFLFDIAESNWPDKLFNKTESISSSIYSERQANDPNMQFNLISPIGKLSGHQHTTLVRLQENDGFIQNVPLKSLIAYNNEVKYLNAVENELASTHGESIKLSLYIDFEKKCYRIKPGIPWSVPYERQFPQVITCSRITSDYGL